MPKAPSKAKTSATPPSRPGAAALASAMRAPRSPLIEPRPLDAAGLRAVEDAAGVALSPSLHALLSFDAGHVRRAFGWFDDQGRFLARPTIDLIREHAGAFAEGYEELCAARFPGMAIPLDRGSDSMRFLYFGEPDAAGEYPVLFVDHDDLPSLGVEAAGFDVYLAKLLHLTVSDARALAKKRAKTLLGVDVWTVETPPVALPDPVAGPPPGSIVHVVVSMGEGPATPTEAPRKLTDKQLDKALFTVAQGGDEARLAELVVLAKGRKGAQGHVDEAVCGAIEGGSLGALELVLREGGSPNALRHRCAVLTRVVHHPNAVALARALLSAGADANGPGTGGKTAVHLAAQHGSPELVRLLLDAGGDANRAAEGGYTPLHLQSSPPSPSPSPELVDLLISKGANPNAGNGVTPLHLALEHRLSAHAERLLAHGANPNARTHGGATALHLAYLHGQDSLVPALLAAGAARETKDERGVSFEAIFGPSGEDIRPITARYSASNEPQRVTITARFAVLEPAYVRNLRQTHSAWRWKQLVDAGLGGGAPFAAGTSSLEVIDEGAFDGQMTGFVERTYVLSVAALAPEFFHVIANDLLGSVLAPYSETRAIHAIRGVAIDIRGENDVGPALDGDTLRRWIVDDAYAPATFQPLPFPLEIREAKATRLVVETVSGEPAQGAHDHVNAWVTMDATWRVRGGAERVKLFPWALPPPNDLEITGVGKSGKSRRFPFELDRPRAHLECVLAALHRRTPLARVVLEIAP